MVEKKNNVLIFLHIQEHTTDLLGMSSILFVQNNNKI